MSRPMVVTQTLSAAVVAAIANAQSLGAAGALTLNGSQATAGVATLSPPGRVGITSAGNDTGITWTVAGTDRNNNKITQTVAGANTGLTAVTTADFATVTSITSSGATASTVTAGTTGVASTQWIPLSNYAPDFQVALYGAVISGTPTWTIEYTLDDVFGTWLPANVPFPRAVALTSMSNQSGNLDGSLPSQEPVRAVRLTQTGAGTTQITVLQQGA